jgi:hypothetical protein
MKQLREENKVDLLVYDLIHACIGMGYALQGKPNPGDFHPRGEVMKADRPGAEDELRSALECFETEFGIRGSSADDRIKSLRIKGGPARRRRLVAKLIKAHSLVQDHSPASDALALSWLGQAAWDYHDQRPHDRPTELTVKDVWPLPPPDDSSLDNLVCAWPPFEQ